MVTISFEVFGDRQVERTLLRLSDAASDMRPAGTDFMKYMRHASVEQFDSQGQSGSGGWAALKPKTIARKRAKGQDRRILHATKRLRKSLTMKSHPDHYERIERDSFTFASRTPYGKHHQHGAPRANVPMRKPVDLTEQNRRDIVKIVQDHLMGAKR